MIDFSEFQLSEKQARIKELLMDEAKEGIENVIMGRQRFFFSPFLGAEDFHSIVADMGYGSDGKRDYGLAGNLGYEIHMPETYSYVYISNLAGTIFFKGRVKNIGYHLRLSETAPAVASIDISDPGMSATTIVGIDSFTTGATTSYFTPVAGMIGTDSGVNPNGVLTVDGHTISFEDIERRVLEAQEEEDGEVESEQGDLDDYNEYEEDLEDEYSERDESTREDNDPF